MRKPILRFSAGAAVSADRPRAALARAGVRPRKSRGQNFLVQERIAERIVALAGLAAGDVVIEIGPGLGVLSAIALRSPLARLILVELDERLAAGLQTRFGHDPRVTVLNQDVLKVDLARLVEAPGPVKVLGNLPFNIAAAILERLCARSRSIARMVLMFQREVADRIRARPGDREYGALTVFAALYWEVSEYFRVAAGSFHPRPKVDAAVLVLKARAAQSLSGVAEAAVRETIRAAFSAPRKTIRNSLAGGLALPSAASEEALVHAGIDPLTRPATLSVEDFARLSRVLYPDNPEAALPGG
jgi:16S rRNA (adenine1518-N6/adenine1519-N6)-dimethyltransferase